MSCWSGCWYIICLVNAIITSIYYNDTILNGNLFPVVISTLINIFLFFVMFNLFEKKPLEPWIAADLEKQLKNALKERDEAIKISDAAAANIGKLYLKYVATCEALQEVKAGC